MNKSRKLSLINMCTNLVLIVLEIIGVYFFTRTNTFDVMDLRYYTILTVFVTFLGAALMIWANIVSYIKKRDCTPRLFYSIRFLSAVMSLITVVVVAAFLAPSQGVKALFDLEGGFVFMHFICPIISVLQFIFLEIETKGKFKKTLEPFILTLIYGFVMIIMVFAIKSAKGAQSAAEFGPYFFFWFTDDLIEAGKSVSQEIVPHPEQLSVAMNIGMLIGVIFIAYIMSAILWVLNRISHNIFIGEVIEVQAKTAPKKKAVAAPVKTGNAFTNYVKKKVAFTGDETPTGGQTYHISYHDRRLKTWKVKTENAGRALKVFPTQKEAIDFANEQVKKNGGSIRVHSMVGKIRKE